MTLRDRAQAMSKSHGISDRKELREASLLPLAPSAHMDKPTPGPLLPHPLLTAGASVEAHLVAHLQEVPQVLLGQEQADGDTARPEASMRSHRSSMSVNMSITTATTCGGKGELSPARGQRPDPRKQALDCSRRPEPVRPSELEGS